jgi:hypothetical protein
VNDWKIIPTIVFTTVLIFGAGVFTGGFLVDYVKQTHPRPASRPTQAAAQNSTSAQSSQSAHPGSTSPGNNTGTGTSAGGSGTNNAAGQGVHPIKPPEILSKEFLQRLDADLRLNKDQHDAVWKIICDGQNEIGKAVHDARLEIREVLNPQQRNAFDDLVKHPFHKPLFGTNAPPATIPFVPPPAPAPAPVDTNQPAGTI